MNSGILNSNLEIEVIPEEILSLLDSRKESKDIIDNQLNWLIEGTFLWCNHVGTLELLKEDSYKKENGMPLIIPGHKYFIHISKLNWNILQNAIIIIIDAIMSDPFEFKKGIALATANTVFTLTNNIVKLTEGERKVITQISQFKKDNHKNPSSIELIRITHLPKKIQQNILDSLVDKNVICISNNCYKIVF